MKKTFQQLKSDTFYLGCIPRPFFLFLMLILPSALLAQTSVVTGKVSSSGDSALIGVNVQVKGTTIAAVTDATGTFTINAAPEATLVFSYIGFSTQEVKIGGRNTVNVRLESSSQQLTDVIVVGYGTQKRGNVTGAVSSVKSAQLVQTPSTTTSGALVGKVPGITTRATDNRPGNGINIQIRNMGNPLFVIDGVPYNANPQTDAFGFSTGTGQDVFNNLGLEDIESITILKDGAAAVYGLRAANGVVLVTTKKGSKNEKPNININGYYGLQNFTRYPKPANAAQYTLARAQGMQNIGGDPRTLYTPEVLAKWQAGTEKYYKSYDYFDMVMRKNVPQSYISASASGGSKRASYYMSASNLNQEAIIRDYSYNRTNLQANIETNLAKGLRIGTQISARLEKTHNVGVPGLDDYFNPFLSVFSMWPTESPYANDNPQYINETHSVNLNPATYKDDVTGYVDNLWRAMNVNLNAQYDFDFGLSLKGIYSYNYMNEDFDGFEYTYDAYRYDTATDTYIKGTGNQNPWRERHKRNVVSRFSQLQIAYTRQFGDHSVYAVGAYEQSDYDNSYFVVHTVPSNNYIPLQSFAEQDYLADEWGMEARAGYIGRIAYNYKQRYLLEVLGRYDGSFLYADGSRYGFFPGMSAGWRISDEPFFTKIKGRVLNDLKLRFSYGETGSEIGVSAFDAIPGYTYNNTVFNAVLDNKYTINVRPRGIPITNLSWVTNRSTNIGVDFSLFDNKLTGSADIFQRKRTGLPAGRYDVRLPNEVGYVLPNENLNSDVTRGIEGQLTYAGRVGDVNIGVGANATFARLKILNTYNPLFENSWQQYRASVEGRWSNIYWGYHVTGQFKSEEEIRNYDINNDQQGNRTQLPGDFKYQDVNGDKIINFMDERPIGYALGAQPYVSFGFTANAAWKGITLRADFAGGALQSFNRNWEIRYPFQNNGNSPDYMLTDVWHRADPYDNTSEWIPGKYPAIRLNNATNNWLPNDFWVMNVKYVRLRNLELGYSFPKKWLERIGVEAFRMYANGTNLFSIDNVKDYGIDPEIASENALVYPQQRLFNFGFNLSL